MCNEEVEDRYYSFDLKNLIKSGISIFFFFLFVVLIPFMSVSFIISMIRSWNSVIHDKLRHSVNHPDLAGIVIISFFLTLYVTGLDIVSAVYAYNKKDEIGRQNHNITGSFNMRVTIILSIYDLSVLIAQTIAFCYMSFNPAGKDNDCCFSCFKWYFSLFFNLMFGESDQTLVWESSNIDTDKKYRNKKNEDASTEIKKKYLISSNIRYLWVLTFCILAPIFSLSSHFMFILMSWLTDSTQATSFAIVYIGTLSFLHVAIRQCYVTNTHRISNACCELTECPDCCLLLYPYQQCCVTLTKFFRYCLCPCMKVFQVTNESSNKNTYETKTESKIQDEYKQSDSSEEGSSLIKADSDGKIYSYEFDESGSRFYNNVVCVIMVCVVLFLIIIGSVVGIILRCVGFWDSIFWLILVVVVIFSIFALIPSLFFSLCHDEEI